MGVMRLQAKEHQGGGKDPPPQVSEEHGPANPGLQTPRLRRCARINACCSKLPGVELCHSALGSRYTVSAQGSGPYLRALGTAASWVSWPGWGSLGRFSSKM